MARTTGMYIAYPDKYSHKLDPQTSAMQPNVSVFLRTGMLFYLKIVLQRKIYLRLKKKTFHATDVCQFISG